MIVNEVGHNLSLEEFNEFIEFINNIPQIDEDFVVPFELCAIYESMGLKSSDAFIAAYVEWTGADALVSENRHFLSRHTKLSFNILSADNCMTLIKSS